MYVSCKCSWLPIGWKGGRAIGCPLHSLQSLPASGASHPPMSRTLQFMEDMQSMVEGTPDPATRTPNAHKSIVCITDLVFLGIIPTREGWNSNLRVCHWYRSNSSIDGRPGASGEHTGKQWVQISSSKSTTVLLHCGHVASDQCLPQPAVVQPELRLKHLRGVTPTRS